MKSDELIKINDRFGAHNYHPLPVVLSEGEGVWVSDVEGKRYLDFLSAYSAVNQGHRHPKIMAALTDQANRLTLSSRAFHHDQLGPFLEKLCTYTGCDMALPMNTGAEAVETAIKMARRWGREKKGIEAEQQQIIVCDQNFHGRTTTIISFSTDEDSRAGFGPYTPGFTVIPFGKVEALTQAITKNTCAFLVEPIQGEAGVRVPPTGFLKTALKVCRDNDVLFIADEVQTGFGRCGARFACDLEDVIPDAYCLGKALGGGVFPVSAVVARNEVMEVFTPGSHGSTFGGNPLACAVATAAIDVLEEENLASRSAELGEYFRQQVAKIECSKMESVRGRGLLNAIVFEPGFEAWDVCVAMAEKGLLTKQTHGNIIRFSPPLVIQQAQIDQALGIMREVMSAL